MTKKIIIAGSVLVLILAYSIQIGMAPKSRLKYLQQSAQEALSKEPRRFDSLCAAAALTPLVKERAYKEALNVLAAQDSIGLIINLQDSTVSLSIKGVIIHINKVNSIDVDPLLSKLTNEVFAGLFSQPLQVIAERTTIVKEPIVIRQAPKDTIEAALNAYKPDTLIQNPAFFQLKLDHGIVLNFDQERNPTWNDKWAGFQFEQIDRTKKVARQFLHFVTFRKQTYEPAISIELPVNDVRSIYRALPDSAYVVLCL